MTSSASGTAASARITVSTPLRSTSRPTESTRRSGAAVGAPAPVAGVNSVEVDAAGHAP